MAGSLFGNVPTHFMKSIGVMSITMDVYNLMETVLANSEEATTFKNCVDLIEGDQVITIDDPVVEFKEGENAADYY
jgi:hypothetical protein